jgi:hypothetical protein
MMTDVAFAAVILVGIGFLIAVPWIMSRRDGRGDSQPSDTLMRLPFPAGMAQQFAILFTVLGVVRLVQGDRLSGLQEIATGVVAAIVLTLWAVRHPGHRWWRWRNE